MATPIINRVLGDRFDQAQPSMAFNFMNKTLTPSIGDSSGWTFARTTTATYFNQAGVRQTAPIDTPRFEYDRTTHEFMGLLMEDARNNYFLNSATPADQTITAGSIWVPRYCLWVEGTGSVDIALGTALGTFTGGTAGNTQRATAGNPVFFNPEQVTAGATTPVKTGTLTLTVSGSLTLVQFEDGSEPSSYIPSGNAVTSRGADMFNNPDILSKPWYNPNECTVVVEGHSFIANNNNSITGVFFDLNDGTSSNRMSIMKSAGYYDHRMLINGASQSVRSNGAWTTDTFKRLGMSLKTGAAHYAFPETNALTVASRDITRLASATKFHVGSSGFTNGSLCGHLRYLTYYPRAMHPDALKATCYALQQPPQ